MDATKRIPSLVFLLNTECSIVRLDYYIVLMVLQLCIHKMIQIYMYFEPIKNIQVKINPTEYPNLYFHNAHRKSTHLINVRSLAVSTFNRRANPQRRWPMHHSTWYRPTPDRRCPSPPSSRSSSRSRSKGRVNHHRSLCLAEKGITHRNYPYSTYYRTTAATRRQQQQQPQTNSR